MEEERTYEKGLRPVSYSVNQWSRIMQYEDMNGAGRLFGGRLMEWIDEVAGIAAIRHSGHDVTTACIDNLQFKAGVFLGDLLIIISRVTYVGNTSMEVRVDSYIEDIPTGMRRPVNRAYVTEVCIDEAGHPVPVPYGLEITSESEKAEYEGAKRRIAMRKQRRQEGF